MRKQLVYRARGVVFMWEGGNYIDVYNSGECPVATLNVWDYRKDEPTILVEWPAFKAECDEWLDGLGPEEIAEYGVKSE